MFEGKTCNPGVFMLSPWTDLCAVVQNYEGSSVQKEQWAKNLNKDISINSPKVAARCI